MQLLGLRGRDAWQDSQVNAVYAELSDAKLEEGYSDRTVAGRRQLLDEVPPNLEACSRYLVVFLPSHPSTACTAAARSLVVQ